MRLNFGGTTCIEKSPRFLNKNETKRIGADLIFQRAIKSYAGLLDFHANRVSLVMEEIFCPVCQAQSFEYLFSSVDAKVSKRKFNVVKCRHCGFIFTNPRPDFEEISQYYGSAYYSYQRPKVKLKRTTKYNNSGRFLDIGSGSGARVLQKANQGLAAFGVEIDDLAIQNGIDQGLNIKKFDGRVLPFEDDFFDIVNMSQVVEHVHDVNRLLAEVRRVLKYPGTLTIDCPNILSYDAMLWGPYWRHLDLPRHLYHFSVGSLSTILADHDFKITQIETYDTRVVEPGLKYLKSVYTALRTYALLNADRGVFLERMLSGVSLAFVNLIKYALHNIHCNNGQMIRCVATKR